MKDAKIRLFVNCPLGAGQAVAITEQQANYLFNVMRLARGGHVLLFNGQSGEWRAEIAQAGKRAGVLICTDQTAPQVMPPDLWLLFAPIKKARMDFIVEKAVEMGAARLCPVQTQHAQSERIRPDKMLAHAIEAAEQCGATFVPAIDPLRPFAQVFANWPQDRLLFWADETLAKEQASPSAPFAATAAPSAIFIGPEGGFSAAEQAHLRAMPLVRPISLGPRILRAETAAVAALALWQAHMGDWTSL